jgi:UDP-glucose 4-epimerase
MRVLITGGAGFLGAALARRLVSEGHAVLVLDDLSSGDEGTLGPGVQFTRGDVRDVPRLWTLMAGVDLLYHLAAKVSVSESILYPVDYNAVNTGGTVAVMSAARDAGLRRVVFVSSGTVYGQPAALPAPETAEALPLNPYAVSKLAAEHYVRAIGNQVRIETVILRVFNAYGPGQALPPAHPPVVPHFLRQVRGGGSVVLHGSPPGAQTRDFIYVDDVVEALLKAGAMGGISGSTFNIGSGRETPIVELVRAIERATGRSAIVMQSPEQSGGVGRLCGDIRSAERMLGWKPRHSLDEGLRRMLQAERG